MRIRLILAALLFCTPLLRAGTLQYPEHNFSIALPAGWTDIKPPPPQMVIASQSADNSRRILVTAVKLPDRERETGAADIRAGARHSLGEMGWKFDPEHQVSINGVPFIAFNSHPPATSPVGMMTTYTTAAGAEVYMLQSIGRAQTDTDPELQSVIQSFRLINPAEVRSLNKRTDSAAYRVGYFIGRFAIFLVIPVIVLVLWLANRSRSRR